MTKKINLLIFSFLGLLLVFAYLTYHHYMTKMGLSGSSLCHINSTLNCDTAALSKYSEVLNIPIAVIGFSYSLIMLGATLFIKFGWSDETPAFSFLYKAITTLSSIVSVVLLAISSLILKVYCPFCILSYIFSFFITYLAFSEFKNSKIDISQLSEEKSFLVSLTFIPVLAWFISGSISDNFGLSALAKMVPEKVYAWQNSPQINFDEKLGLIKTSKIESKATLVEFADFKCPHCKSAAQTFKLFLSSKNNIKFVFKPYPLDGTCNPSIPNKGDGSRCELAGWVLCAERIYKKGWEMYYWIFENQENLSFTSDLTTSLEEVSNLYGLNGSEIKSCATSAETFELIKKTSLEGEAAKISGTPSIFLNGKRLDYGQYIDVLNGALKTLE